MKSKQIEEDYIRLKNLLNIVDKLEQRISTLEKVIGKLQLRLGDVVLYIDKKGESKDPYINLMERGEREWVI